MDSRIVLRVLMALALSSVMVAAVLVPMGFSQVIGGASQAGSARGQAGPVADDGAVMSPDLARAAAMAHWTPARMSAARPLLKTLSIGGKSESVPEPRLRPTNPDFVVAFRVEGNLPGTPPGAGPFAESTGSIALSSASCTFTLVPFPAPIHPGCPPETTKEVIPFSLYNGPVPGTLGIYPWITNGKLFGTTPTGAGFSCSGTSVTSAFGGNRSLVFTAGHCLNDGGFPPFDGIWLTNIIFCPAWRDFSAPIGCFPAQRLFVLGGWFATSNLRRDVGIAVVGPNIFGQLLGDAVGTQGLLVNAPRIQQWEAFGYPVNLGGTQRLIKCNTSRFRDDLRLDTFFPGPGPTTVSYGCRSTFGASGGGVIARWKFGSSAVTPPAWGYVNGNNSYLWISPNEVGRVTQSPYYDSATFNMWNAARSIPVSP